jgi:hypothetical protein
MAPRDVDVQQLLPLLLEFPAAAKRSNALRGFVTRDRKGRRTGVCYAHG